MLEWLSQDSISLNPFVWHSNSYLKFNLSHGMHIALEYHTNERNRKNLNYSIATEITALIATLKAEEEY